MGPDVIYVTGRRRKVGEINGKSCNLNNCLKKVVYASWPRHEETVSGGHGGAWWASPAF